MISQYIGSRNQRAGSLSASQLVTVSALFSIALAAAVLLADRPLLALLFGEVDREVMEACVTYLRISAFSYPAIAIYNAGAAMCLDWGIRALFFWHRFCKGRWKEFQVI